MYSLVAKKRKIIKEHLRNVYWVKAINIFEIIMYFVIVLCLLFLL